jgi:fatty-acyl-CoA synthase
LRLRGYLVNPTEIENLIVEQGLVSEVQVVGVPNAATGEEQAVAFVIAEPDDSLEDRIREYCRDQAASWKVPDAVIALEAFPMTPGANGDKVQKGQLRDLGAKHLTERGILG